MAERKTNEVRETKPVPRVEEKRGGYSGRTDAANVPPPAKIPSGSAPQAPTKSAGK